MSFVCVLHNVICANCEDWVSCSNLLVMSYLKGHYPCMSKCNLLCWDLFIGDAMFFISLFRRLAIYKHIVIRISKSSSLRSFQFITLSSSSVIRSWRYENFISGSDSHNYWSCVDNHEEEQYTADNNTRIRPSDVRAWSLLNIAAMILLCFYSCHSTSSGAEECWSAYPGSTTNLSGDFFIGVWSLFVSSLAALPAAELRKVEAVIPATHPMWVETFLARTLFYIDEVSVGHYYITCMMNVTCISEHYSPISL